MVILLKQDTTKEQIRNFSDQMKEYGLEAHITVGQAHTIVGLVGDSVHVDIDMLKAMGCKLFQGYFFSKPVPLDEFEKLPLIWE